MSHKRNVQQARKRYDKAVSAVYACAPNGNTPFSECLKLAPQAVRETLETAQSALVAAECAAVSAGKAYRSSIGGLVWYR